MNISIPKADSRYSEEIFQNPSTQEAASTENQVFITDSYEETFEFGMILGKTLGKGSVVALKGTLGSGKTCLCAGICRALGVTAPVTSPTYTIVHEYEGVFPVYHIDAYRLSGAEDFENAAGGEILSGDGVCLIEWGERLSECLPDDAVHVEITVLDGGKREIKTAGRIGISGGGRVRLQAEN
ncbi:MAG: tRNA (adenosine(37)-N6)-threonylcarbamoyltransferase complex ATPase subunit type 1 TsaE [Spirochaetaceae bacterium]|nr:tRNA (adenosine(37)-N6)-threonylcarbamoyltransferase complex ATPase subunit type 1 TsaE [Spirochaetaceae bacterium]